MANAYIYIMTNKPLGVLYVGVTSNLKQRIYQHKRRKSDGFTKKYNLHSLVYFEIFDDNYHAICREKQLKKWHRAWKIKLIEKTNPQWRDLYDGL
ncbi:GIY-YIG nuclease family protein [Aliiglaciecola litoralis]|uniref:GIY-YIG nuclease family protein n=1 Tax=Aliiglaciecola litoralis TaxID=582857 RepID=A0ABP3WW98_9ALTE